MQACLSWPSVAVHITSPVFAQALHQNFSSSQPEMQTSAYQDNPLHNRTLGTQLNAHKCFIGMCDTSSYNGPQVEQQWKSAEE